MICVDGVDLVHLRHQNNSLGWIVSLQHYDENTSIHFESSNKEDFLEAKEHLDQLLRKAPCDSNCRLKITFDKDVFKGILEVRSPGKSFRVEDQSETVKVLHESLFTQITKELDQWKKDRSLEDITGSIKLRSFSVEKSKVKRK